MVELTRCSHVAKFTRCNHVAEFTRGSHVAEFTRCSRMAGVYKMQSRGRSLPGAVTWQEFTRYSHVAKFICRCSHVAKVFQVQSDKKV
jgi:hypothetical protein